MPRQRQSTDTTEVQDLTFLYSRSRIDTTVSLYRKILKLWSKQLNSTSFCQNRFQTSHLPQFVGFREFWLNDYFENKQKVKGMIVTCMPTQFVVDFIILFFSFQHMFLPNYRHNNNINSIFEELSNLLHSFLSRTDVISYLLFKLINLSLNCGDEKLTTIQYNILYIYLVI